MCKVKGLTRNDKPTDYITQLCRYESLCHFSSKNVKDLLVPAS